MIEFKDYVASHPATSGLGFIGVLILAGVGTYVFAASLL
jgi:hypothetical protein